MKNELKYVLLHKYTLSVKTHTTFKPLQELSNSEALEFNKLKDAKAYISKNLLWALRPIKINKNSFYKSATGFTADNKEYFYKID